MVPPQLPAPATLTHRYFTLAEGDRDEYLAQFTDDAVVEDEGRTHHGIAAIRAWWGSVPEVSYRVLDVGHAGTSHRATAQISGSFPGSPVTLVLTLAFVGDKITRLTIRPA